MKPSARIWVSVLSAAMLGFWLNVAAMMIVATSNGLSGVPSPFLEIIYVAFWPTWLQGVPHEVWFYPDGTRHMLGNIAAWTAAGAIVGVALALLGSQSQLAVDPPRVDGKG
jgi:hypothetical protein